MKNSTSLRRQIVQLCVTLISITVFFVIANVWWSTAKFNQQKVASSVDNAQNVFKQFQGAQAKLLITAAKVLTADFGFKQAVASSDSATIKSALQNHASRIDSDMMLITSLGGELIASTDSIEFDDEKLKSQIATLVSYPGEAHYIVLGDALYLSILLPVKAPRPIAYSVVGFKIDSAVAKELKRLTSLDISFVVGQQRVIASSLEQQQQSQALENIDVLSDRFSFSRPQTTSEKLVLEGSNQQPVAILFTIDLQASYQELDSLIGGILLVALVASLISWLLSGLYARKLANPLARLVKTAEKFAQGHYSSSIEARSANHEIKALQDSFVHMGKEIEQREQQILFQSEHDRLTGLLNRRALLTRLESLLLHRQPLVVCAFSIRGFRAINDNFGPLIADACLKSIALKMQNQESGKDSLLSRIGGDEFVAVLPYDLAESEHARIEPFIQAIDSTIDVENLSLNLNFNFGICLVPEHGTEADSLLRKTIIALEHGVHEKSRLRFYQNGEDERHLQRLKLIDQLKKDLDKDSGNLYMCFQPKLNFHSDQVEKLEALIRWETDEGEFISPELFIELAENSGLIIELTRWVLLTVFKQIEQWKNLGFDLKVAINVSSQDICDPNLIPFLEKNMAKYGVNAKDLCLELTERDLMDNESIAINSLNKIKNIGIEISVDDYGIGQSSLAKLKQLPVDELKIDKSFILQLDQSESDQLIVSSTIDLAHNLGLTVVAEGVENRQSMTMLKEMGCDQFQGYYLSKPVKPKELIPWYQSGQVNELL